MNYFVVLRDTTIQEMTGLELSRLQKPVYAISESRRSALYNALRCLEDKLEKLKRHDRPGVGSWWLEDYKSLMVRKDELLGMQDD